MRIQNSERLGWRPDIPDWLDHKYEDHLSPCPTLHINALKNFGDLALSPYAVMVPGFSKLKPWNQGQTSSCVGCSVSKMDQLITGLSPRSALHVYYEARRLINETEMDQGSYIRDAMKVISTLGSGRSAYWPFDESKVLVDPADKEDRDAAKHKVLTYTRAEMIGESQHCLETGHPYVTGLTVYDNFMTETTARSGVVTLPSGTDRQVGGHALLFGGRDPNFRESGWAQSLIANGYPASAIPEIVRVGLNSWGDWGRGGFFVVDERYQANPDLADDTWTARKNAKAAPVAPVAPAA